MELYETKICAYRDVLVFFVLFVMQSSITFSYPLPKWNNLENSGSIKLTYDSDISDEFHGFSLNKDKWSITGITNGNTGCPKWNGPVYWRDLKFSTYFQTIPSNEKSNQIVRWGKLKIKVTEKSLSYFINREYYCDPKTFRCNWDSSIECFGTNYWGFPYLKDQNDLTSYLWADHDKCKKEPYCIPSPEFVTKSRRIYNKYLGVNIVGRNLFKYGFIEARVRLARSSAVNAIWMHDDNYNPGFSRWTNDSNDYPYRETPSYIRSRRWQEIDMLEAMNSEIRNMYKRYIPNIHVFAGYKGEYTQSSDSTSSMGPIVLDKEALRQRNPTFTDPSTKSNEYHLNYGTAAEIDEEWASNWRTIGLYWTDKEIRFLLDGVETVRLKNKLVHQPMFMSISAGLNRGWAGRDPERNELGRWTEIDYIRRWTIDKTDGEEAASDLEASDSMSEKFRFIGDEFLSIEGKFPVEDDGLTLEIPNRNQERAGPWNHISKFWSTVTSPKKSKHEEGISLPNQHRSQESGYVPKFSKREKRMLFASNARYHEMSSEDACLTSARTVLEETNPQTNLGGWATGDGQGYDAGVTPYGYCLHSASN